MTRRRRTTAGIFVLAVLAIGLVAPAFAQGQANVRLRDARLEPDGSTRLVVSVDGLEGTVLSGDAFQVYEDGQRITGLEVEPVVAAGAEQDVVALLVLDTSFSMQGEPLERIKLAASQTVDTLTGQGIAVGLMEFSAEVSVLEEPTTDPAPLHAAIDGLVHRSRTALYDAVVDAVALMEGYEGIVNIVVFADGEDNHSSATLEDAVRTATDANFPLTMVVLETERLDLSALEPLAQDTGGRMLNVAEVEDLDDVFAVLAADIASQYVIQYASTITEPVELPVTVIVDTPVGEAQVNSLAINSRNPDLVQTRELAPSRLAQPILTAFAGPAGLWVGLASAFLGALIMLWFLLVRPVKSVGARSLEFGLGRYRRRSEEDQESHLPTANITERAIEFVSRVPKPEGFEDRMQLRMDRAAWPMRVNEFLVLSVGTALLGGLLLYSVADVLGLILGLAVGAAVPSLVMQLKIERRKRAFMDQLPPTLQLLAGSLRAGYGLMQAIDTVVQEAEDPTSSEFARVLTEVRLGMPVEEALESMALRMDSEDFRWVVLAINIQREVGGNLAELLSTIAGTMRSRAQLRRQIKVLSAEGRISAWVVGLMPFIVALILSVLNPGYLTELVTRIEGLVMVAVGIVLMIAGGLWLKKIVSIEV